MKKIAVLPIMLCIISVLVNPNSSYAQHENPNVVKLNILSAAIGFIQPGYERALNDKMSVGAYGSFYNRSVSTTDFFTGDKIKFTYGGIGIVPEFKYYVTNESKPAPAGFYAGPYLYYLNLKMKVEVPAGEGSVSAGIFGGGLTLGYQWLISDVFAIDVFGGVGYLAGSLGDVVITDNANNTERYSTSLKVAGTIPRIGTSIGFAF